MRLIDVDVLLNVMDERYKEKQDIVPDNLAEGFMQMEKLIKEQPIVNTWVPCSERLPEDIVKDCLVTLENGAVFQASYSSIGQEFRMICWHGI